MFKALSLMFALTFSGALAHADVAMPWEIQSVEIQEVPDSGPAVVMNTPATGCSSDTVNPFSFEEIGWAEIINIGQKVWSIVEAGKPVVHVETPVAYALPRGLTCWQDLEHWAAPITKSYEVTYKNGFGMEAVKFRFRLHYTYGGGKGSLGKYLANVTVMPAELNVIWGYNFDAKVEVAQAINMGSNTDPMAGLEMNIKWNVKTVMKESQNSFHFFVQGDGNAQVAE